jgi:hypothetical protein
MQLKTLSQIFLPNLARGSLSANWRPYLMMHSNKVFERKFILCYTVLFAFYHSKTLFRLSIKEYNIYQISS